MSLNPLQGGQVILAADKEDYCLWLSFYPCHNRKYQLNFYSPISHVIISILPAEEVHCWQMHSQNTVKERSNNSQPQNKQKCHSAHVFSYRTVSTGTSKHIKSIHWQNTLIHWPSWTRAPKDPVPHSWAEFCMLKTFITHKWGCLWRVPTGGSNTWIRQ